MRLELWPKELDWMGLQDRTGLQGLKGLQGLLDVTRVGQLTVVDDMRDLWKVTTEDLSMRTSSPRLLLITKT